METSKRKNKVSKNAARKGQAFSSAICVGRLEIDKEIEFIKDIERDGKTFSDGWGYIDEAYAKEIAKEFYGVTSCFAFQIRMGGYKGVLVAK